MVERPLMCAVPSLRCPSSYPSSLVLQPPKRPPRVRRSSASAGRPAMPLPMRLGWRSASGPATAAGTGLATRCVVGGPVHLSSQAPQGCAVYSSVSCILLSATRLTLAQLGMAGGPTTPTSSGGARSVGRCGWEGWRSGTRTEQILGTRVLRRLRRKTPKFGRIQAGFARHGPNSADLEPSYAFGLGWAKIGLSSTKLDQTLPGIDHHRPSIFQHRLEFDQCWPDIGQLWTEKSTNTRPGKSNMATTSISFGPMSTNV